MTVFEDSNGLIICYYPTHPFFRKSGSQKEDQITYAIALLGISVTLALWNYVSIYMLLGTVNYFTLLLGLTFLGKNQKLHALFMGTAIASDLFLVFALEFKYSVIAETLSVKLSSFNQVHIFCSLMAVILYFPAVFLGSRLLKSTSASPRLKLTHRRIGMGVLGFRTVGFILMFTMKGLHAVS